MIKEKEIKVKDLEIPKVDEKFIKFKKIIDLFSEESAPNTIEIFNGMNEVIDSFIKEENSKRKLADLPAEFLD